eukprot:TRINITY_DN7890_c0_g1_i3.p2 TRINITY_DN7890_c0_g1~~TRINITY_DN7890_c0_g1_i3.p2  ORF type:complete len:123 (+),score=24.73 TRINITY_DN7890_c0_g1_i3:50-418(+)
MWMQEASHACSNKLLRMSCRDMRRLSGHVQALGVSTPVTQCSASDKKKKMHFKTSVVLTRPSTGPAPETEAFVREQTRKMQRNKDEPEQQQSFFAKYWMYIVPAMLLFNVLTAVNAPKQQQR